jgi:hypothetical protein
MPRLSNTRRRAVLLVVSAFVLLVAPALARPAASEPTTAELALAAADFPQGAKVLKQRYVKATAPATSSYSREFRPGARAGSTTLLLLEVEAGLYPTPEDAAAEVREFRRMLASKNGRTLFANALAAGFRQESKVKLKRVAVSSPVSVGTGQSSMHASATFVLANGRQVALHFVLVQTDRAMAFLLATPVGPRFPKADVRALARLQGDRLQRSFTVASVAPPTVTGTAAPTQTLTASAGDWSGAPSQYAYQWSRCDSTATTCADIPGATSATYVVAAEDTGSVLRATVVARNSVSSSTATSAVTGPVA